MNDPASALQKTRTQLAELERLLAELKETTAELEKAEESVRHDRVSASAIIAGLSQLDSGGTQVDLAESFLDALVDLVDRSILFTRGGDGRLRAAVARGFDGAPWREATAGGDHDPVQMAADAMEVVEFGPEVRRQAAWMSSLPVSGHSAAIPLLFGDAVQAVLYVESSARLPIGAVRLITQFTTVVFQNHYLREMVDALGGTAPVAAAAGTVAAQERAVSADDSPRAPAGEEEPATEEAHEEAFTTEKPEPPPPAPEEEEEEKERREPQEAAEADLPEPADVVAPPPPGVLEPELPKEEEEVGEEETKVEESAAQSREPAAAEEPDERLPREQAAEAEFPDKEITQDFPDEEEVLEIDSLSGVDAEDLGLSAEEFERLMGQAAADWQNVEAGRSETGAAAGADRTTRQELESEAEASFNEALERVLPPQESQETAGDGEVPVGAEPPSAGEARAADTGIIPEVARPKELESAHSEARRFARLLVAEIKLYNESAVDEGRKAGDLYDRLQDDIDRSREMYEKRAQAEVRNEFDYFHEEIVRVLADGSPELLGPAYPGSRVGEV